MEYLNIGDPDMKRMLSLFFMILLGLCPVISFQVFAATADDIRRPAYAGSFYPETQAELTALIKHLTDGVKQTHMNPPPKTSLKAKCNR